MTGAEIVAFAGLAAALVLAPGPALAVSIRNGMALGSRRAMLTVLGLASGTLAHGLLATIGSAGLLQASPTAANVLRAAGATYLTYLAAGALRSALRRGTRRARQMAKVNQPTRVPARVAFREGLLTNLLNPKPALFYLAVFPLFLDGERSLAGLVLVAMHLTLIVSWYGFCATASSRLTSLFASPAAVRGIDAVLGLSLLVVAAGLLAG